VRPVVSPFHAEYFPSQPIMFLFSLGTFTAVCQALFVESEILVQAWECFESPFIPSFWVFSCVFVVQSARNETLRGRMHDSFSVSFKNQFDSLWWNFVLGFCNNVVLGNI